VESGGRLYVICGEDVKVVDLASGNPVRTFADAASPVKPRATGAPRIELATSIGASSPVLLVDDGLWVVADGVRLVDLDTGATTATFPDATSVGVSDGHAGLTSAKRVDELESSTGKVVGGLPIPPGAGWVDALCGYLWGWETTDSTTTLHRLGSNGATLWSQSGPFYLNVNWNLNLVPAAGSCWATLMVPRTDDLALVRVDPHCGVLTDTQAPVGVELHGDAFWSVRYDSGDVGSIQQVDPATWQPVGRVWSIWNGRFFAAGGTLWTHTDDELERLDVPVVTTPALPAGTCSPSGT
jgi:hypothetical protein